MAKDDAQQAEKEQAAAERAAAKAERTAAREQRKADRAAQGLPPDPADEVEEEDEAEGPPAPTQLPA